MISLRQPITVEESLFSRVWAYALINLSGSNWKISDGLYPKHHYLLYGDLPAGLWSVWTNPLLIPKTMAAPMFGEATTAKLLYQKYPACGLYSEIEKVEIGYLLTTYNKFAISLSLESVFLSFFLAIRASIKTLSPPCPDSKEWQKNYHSSHVH